MEEKEFSVFIEKIIQEEFKGEVLAFKVTGPDMINSLYRGSSLAHDSKSGGINFIEEGKAVVAFVALLVSTYKTGKEIWQAIKAKSEKASTEKIASGWKKAMIDEGINADIAERIAKKYSENLAKPAA